MGKNIQVRGSDLQTYNQFFADASIDPAIDGDLSLIDTDAEAQAVDLTANTGGASTGLWSAPILLRLLGRLLQNVANKLRTGSQTAANSLSVVIASGTTVSTSIAANSSTTNVTVSANSVAIVTAGTAVQFSATSTQFESIAIQAVKAAGAANSAAVRIGTATNQSILLNPGDRIQLSAPAGKKLNLTGFYLNGSTATDAVAWLTIN